MSALEYSESHFENFAPSFDPEVAARTIAARFGVRYEDMMGPARWGTLPIARRALYRVLRAQGWSLPQIGRFVGRDHTTVMIALRKGAVRT
jgi:chromosomal replication initiation ATPase DnaA